MDLATLELGQISDSQFKDKNDIDLPRRIHDIHCARVCTHACVRNTGLGFAPISTRIGVGLTSLLAMLVFCTATAPACHVMSYFNPNHGSGAQEEYDGAKADLFRAFLFFFPHLLCTHNTRNSHG